VIDLILIRHGATAGNLQKRNIGKTDEPLCRIGMEQARKLSQMDFRAEHIFVSPMLRTMQTVQLAFPNRPYNIVRDLSETDFGIFEGKTADEMSEDKAYRMWVETKCLGPIPKGESVEDFKRRCCDAFLKAVSALPDNTSAAFVIHGGVIMAILEKFGPEHIGFYDFHIPNGGYIFCRYSNGRIELLEKHGIKDNGGQDFEQK